MMEKYKIIVKEKYPNARSERHVTNNGEVYWLIRPRLRSMYIGKGKTQKQAWQDAATRTQK